MPTPVDNSAPEPGYTIAAGDQVAASRTLFEQTGNPVFVWRAILLCLRPGDGHAPRGLPDWCLGYLANCADGILRLCELRDPQNLGSRRDGETEDKYNGRVAEWRRGPTVSPKEATALVAAALGLKKKGRNRIGEANREVQRFLDTALSEWLGSLLAPGTKTPIFNEDQCRKIVMANRGVDERQAKNRIKAGSAVLRTLADRGR